MAQGARVLVEDVHMESRLSGGRLPMGVQHRDMFERRTRKCSESGMKTESSNRHRILRGYAVRLLVRRVLAVMLYTARLCAFGILNFCRPVVVPILSWLALGGVALWVIFVPIAGDSQFPTWRVLTMSVSCGVGAVVYYALLEWLRPVRRGR